MWQSLPEAQSGSKRGKMTKSLCKMCWTIPALWDGYCRVCSVLHKKGMRFKFPLKLHADWQQPNPEADRVRASRIEEYARRASAGEPLFPWHREGRGE